MDGRLDAQAVALWLEGFSTASKGPGGKLLKVDNLDDLHWGMCCLNLLARNSFRHAYWMLVRNCMNALFNWVKPLIQLVQAANR